MDRLTTEQRKLIIANENNANLQDLSDQFKKSIALIVQLSSERVESLLDSKNIRGDWVLFFIDDQNIDKPELSNRLDRAKNLYERYQPKDSEGVKFFFSYIEKLINSKSDSIKLSSDVYTLFADDFWKSLKIENNVHYDPYSE